MEQKGDQTGPAHRKQLRGRAGGGREYGMRTRQRGGKRGLFVLPLPRCDTTRHSNTMYRLSEQHPGERAAQGSSMHQAVYATVQWLRRQRDSTRSCTSGKPFCLRLSDFYSRRGTADIRLGNNSTPRRCKACGINAHGPSALLSTAHNERVSVERVFCVSGPLEVCAPLLASP